MVEQRFCKPLVGSSNLSPGTSATNDLEAISGGQSSQKMQMGRTGEDRIRGKRLAGPIAGCSWFYDRALCLSGRISCKRSRKRSRLSSLGHSSWWPIRMAPAAIIAKRFARSGPPGSQAPEPGDNHCRFRRSVGVQKYTNQPNVGDQLVAGGQDACSPFGS